MDILLDKPYVFLGSRLKRLAEQMQADASLLAQEAGTHVPAGLYPLLALLQNNVLHTVGNLAQATKVSQPAMTKSIAKLLEAGLVTTQVGATDKRQSVIVLTEAGSAAIEQGRRVVWPLIDTVVRELLEGLSGPLLEQVQRIEERLSECSLTQRAARIAALELQPVSDPDVADVVSLLNRAYRGSGANAGWTTEADIIDGDRISEATLRQELADKTDATLVVWKPRGKVEGCVWLEPTQEGVWYLGSLAIDPQLQNLQFGRRMLEAAEQWCRVRGGRSVSMTVIDVRHTLVGWYERRGYRLTGETEPFPYSDSRFGTPKASGLQFAVLTKSLMQ